MLPSLKNWRGAKTKVLSKREEKKRINTRYNSLLIFQLGFIVCLLGAFLIIESGFVLSEGTAYAMRAEPSLDEVYDQPWVLEVDQPVKIEQPKVIQRPKVLPTVTHTFVPVDNNTVVTETDVAPTEVTPLTPVVTTTLPIKKEEPAATRNIHQVDEVPAFPGCEGFTTKEERLACFSSKINAFIGRKFDTDKFSDKYEGKRPRINVQFTIDAYGNVVDVLARAPGKDLEREATSVISRLPKMTPAKKGDKNVNMIYHIPIVVETNY